jgi:hypothetical protein
LARPGGVSAARAFWTVRDTRELKLDTRKAQQSWLVRSASVANVIIQEGVQTNESMTRSSQVHMMTVTWRVPCIHAERGADENPRRAPATSRWLFRESGRLPQPGEKLSSSPNRFYMYRRGRAPGWRWRPAGELRPLDAEVHD